MDEKGRLSLPAAFRRGEGEDRFVLLQWEKSHLTLFPEEKWNEVEDRLDEYRKTGRQAMNQVRLLYATLVEVSPDRQGRILVPAHLQQAGALGGTVLLLGMRDRIELWAPDTYDRVVQAEAGDFDQFAHRLFG